MAKKKRDNRRGPVPSAKRRRVRGIRSRPDEMRLKGQDYKAFLGSSVLDATLSRTVEGASSISLTIEDPKRRVLKDKFSEERFDLELDGLWFRLVGLRKEGPVFTATFEDRVVAELRRQKGSKVAYRDKVTRAEFVRSLVRELRGDNVRLYIPELHKEQPIEDEPAAKQDELSIDDKKGKQGLDMTAKLTVKGSPASSTQMKNADTCLRVAASLGAPRSAMIALIAAVIVESEIQNLTYGSEDSLGILQLRVSLHGVEAATSIVKSVTLFLKEGFTGQGGAIAHANKGIDPATSAQMCQGSAPNVYGQYIEEARRWVDAFDGGGLSGVQSATMVKTVRYAFERGKNENSWDCIQRLAEEVRWRAFVSAGIFYYVSEDDLMVGRPWAVIEEDTPGVWDVDFDYHLGKKTTTATVTGTAQAWAGPPGTVVRLSDDYGAAAGRYLITRVDSNLFNRDVTYTLSKPMEPLPEPAPETVEKTVEFGDAGGAGAASASSLEKITLKGTSPGEPDWGGSRYIFDQFVHPFMKSKGLSPGSQKRPTNTGSGTSDHWTGSTLAYATDYPTTSGEGAARALAGAMGFGAWQPNSYASFTITVDGHKFQVQILWGAEIDHADHVHVGMHRV